MEYKYAGDGVYDTVYIDFRLEKDARLFQSVTGLHVGNESVIQIEGLRPGKRLMRGAYYALNAELLKDNARVSITPVEDDALIGFNIQILDNQEARLLESHAPLDPEETIVEQWMKEGLPSFGKHEYKLRVYDVGQGNHNEILIGDAVCIVFDAGCTYPSSKSLLNSLISKRIVEYQKAHPLLVISHWDCDHISQLKIMAENQQHDCFCGWVGL